MRLLLLTILQSALTVGGMGLINLAVDGKPLSIKPLLEAMVTWQGIVGVLLLIGSFGLFEWALQQGASEAEARTIAINVFAVGQSFYLLNCRSLRFSMFRLGLFSNPWIWAGIAAMIAAQLLFTYLPLMNWLFHTAPIGWMDWLHIVLVGLVIYLVIGAEKAWRLRREAGDRET